MDSRRHTILAVDDEPDVLDSLRHLFHRTYNVLTASSAIEALEALGQPGTIHVILSDQRMPGMTGDEFLARAREIAPDAIRLLFTGYADIQGVMNAINNGGIFRYILKPWDPIELEGILHQAVDQFELLADRRRLIAELQETNTRLIRANRALAEADQLKTAFLEVASHELNTPITIVQGLSELLLLTEGETGCDNHEVIEQINEGTRQLGRLVSNMLKLVAAGEFRDRLRTETVELESLIRESVDRVRPFLKMRSLDLRLEIDPELGLFTIDPDKCRDVLMNLLSNAIKFTPDGGAIGLSARLVRPAPDRPDDPEMAEIIVSDNGIGLEPRALSRLFSPFFTEFDTKLHSTGNFEFNKRGLGLGLYLVRTFVEMHGGVVNARSVQQIEAADPNDAHPSAAHGTAVTVRLPRKPCHKPQGQIEWDRDPSDRTSDAAAPRTGV
jgi:signal transduction histidine kinase